MYNKYENTRMLSFWCWYDIESIVSKALTAKSNIIYRFNEFVLYNYNTVIVVCGVHVLGNNIKNVEDGTDLSP